MIPEVHGDSIQIGLFVHLRWYIVGLILSVVRIGLKLIDVIDATLSNHIRILRVLSASYLVFSLDLFNADLTFIDHFCVPVATTVIDNFFLGMRVAIHVISFLIHGHKDIYDNYDELYILLIFLK